MTDRRAAFHPSPVRSARWWAAIAALLFAAQSVLAIAPPAPTSGDTLLIANATRLPAVAHLREVGAAVPVVTQGFKGQPAAHGDGTPPFPVPTQYPLERRAGVATQSLHPLPAVPLQGTVRRAHRARAPPRRP